MQTELRILNGLHRGGILPLDESTLLIGAHEDADIVLVDDGILDHHASLQKTDQGWVVTADAGLVFGTEQTLPQMLVDLHSGDFFRLGETWLVISDTHAEWQSIPQIQSNENAFEKTDYEDDDSAVTAGATQDADKVTANQAGQESVFEPAFSTHAGIPGLPDSAAGEIKNGAEATAVAPAATSVKRRFKLPAWRKWMIAPACLFALLSAVGAYAYTAKPSLPKLSHPEIPAEWRTEKSTEMSSSTTKDDLSTRHDASGSASAATLTRTLPAQVAATPVVPAPVALQAAFRKRMKEADLLQRFDLDLNETAWSMRAHLDDEESARFERILKAFVVEHKISFPISAKVGSAEAMLPFQIRQIVTGSNAGIVTGDGERIYVGDELLGVKLMAVVDNHLTFMGKRKIEVIW